MIALPAGVKVWLAAGADTRLGIWSPGRKEHADRGGRHVHFALSVTRGRNRVELWDFFRDGNGRSEGVDALRE